MSLTPHWSTLFWHKFNNCGCVRRMCKVCRNK